MITKNELSSLNLSPTKKDFVQIWNELIEVASKITERWDPTSTNESDPGIVLLKVLAGIADKLNYNIDKNILEAFMPTAAQRESMQKLCELVGYDIKYYQSAETTVRIGYTGDTALDSEERLPDRGLRIPKFTTITNADKDITFVTTNTIPALITNDMPWVEVPCIEGQISQCESTNENNLITLSQLDSNNRYYLPEIQIAENGIFVYSAATIIGTDDTSALTDGAIWTQVSNLNTQSLNARVYRFGYDSFEGRPYLAFPDDIGSLIGDGLFIYFIRTSGLNGNISPRTLEVLEIPADSIWEEYSAEQFEVINVDATTNGANIENISTAYNNFKKTVGTFDTLVTCRDYMNKIYSLMDASNSPYVSNILVTDIRNDINKAVTLCSCNEFGILYKEMPLTKPVKVTGTNTASKYQVESITDDNGESVNRLTITSGPTELETDVPLIDHFDLLLYPFRTFTQVSSGTDKLADSYNKSFTYTERMNKDIAASLASFKTCAHNLTTPADGDVVMINNYLQLNALIATSMRVSEIEAKDILKNIKVALVNEFNLRNLDFGEEIPFDSILSTIENADSRIKAVSLQEPKVLTTYSIKEPTVDGATSNEYGIVSATGETVEGVTYNDSYKTAQGESIKDIYNRLTLRNILAGRAALFNYDETFIPNNSEKPYTITKDVTTRVIDGTEDKAVSIKETVDKIVDKEDGPKPHDSAEYILYNDNNEILKNGFHSSDSILTLRVFNKDITNEVLEADETNNTATQIKNFIDSIKNKSGDYTKYESGDPIIGLAEGRVTLVVSSMSTVGEPETIAKKVEVYERAFEVYETYEYDFTKQANSFDASTSQEEAVALFDRGRRSSDTTVGSNIIKDIKRVEAVCEISSNVKNDGLPVFNNIKLNKNEVIKFRAPNLITTKTFPAYVYYRFERAGINAGHGNSGGGSDGTYAAALSLVSFINTIGATRFFGGYSVDNEGTHIADVLYSGLLQKAFAEDPNNLKSFTAKLIVRKEKDENGQEIVRFTSPKDSINQSSELPKVFSTAITCSALVGDNTIKKVLVDEGALYNYLEERANQSGAAMSVGDPAQTLEIQFKYYPLTESTMYIWGSYVRECYSKKFNFMLPDDGVTTFWRLSQTNNYPKGRLVVASGQKLLEQTNEYLKDNDAGTTTYLCTDHGSDPVFSTIDTGSDVELRAGDKLYIHYTPSSTNEDGETVNAEPISIVYEGGDIEDPVIIKPSGFTLMPSDEVVTSQRISWKKTDVEFAGHGKKNLLALAPNEQIEMRSISRVVLDAPARFYKNFDNAWLETGSSSEEYSYELKDGEYIFYTDQNTQEAAYYGSGSVITLSKNTYIPKATDIIEVSQILEQGLHVVPWSNIVLLNPNRKITITEYQYVTLTEGDTLNTLTIDTSSAANYLQKDNKYIINNTKWTKCFSTDNTPITYTSAGAETPEELPKIALTSGPSTSWEVCSFLELSTSPGYAQPLRAMTTAEDGPLTFLVNKVIIYPDEGTGIGDPIEIAPQKTAIIASNGKETFEEVSIKLDTIAQVASGSFEKPDSDNSKETPDLQLKVFKEDPPIIIELADPERSLTPISDKTTSSILAEASSENLNNYWTKIDVASTFWRTPENAVEDTPNIQRALNLNFMVPDSDLFGIFSIYLEVPSSNLNSSSLQGIPDSGSRVFIDVPKEFGSYENVISIFNYNELVKEETETKDYHWWSEGVDATTANRLYLRAGLNCIRIDKSCNLLIKSESKAAGNILYDNMRLVKGKATNGINLALLDPNAQYAQATDEIKVTMADDVLKKINNLDKNHDFYYNVPIENSLAIEFDENISSFSNPYTLYDINNINNSFVVSKLDVKYLETGLKIAKSSKYSGVNNL